MWNCRMILGGGRGAGGRVGGSKEVVAEATTPVGLLTSRTDWVGEKRWQAKEGRHEGEEKSGFGGGGLGELGGLGGRGFGEQAGWRGGGRGAR